MDSSMLAMDQSIRGQCLWTQLGAAQFPGLPINLFGLWALVKAGVLDTNWSQIWVHDNYPADPQRGREKASLWLPART